MTTYTCEGTCTDEGLLCPSTFGHPCPHTKPVKKKKSKWKAQPEDVERVAKHFRAVLDAAMVDDDNEFIYIACDERGHNRFLPHALGTWMPIKVNGKTMPVLRLDKAGVRRGMLAMATGVIAPATAEIKSLGTYKWAYPSEINF